MSYFDGTLKYLGHKGLISADIVEAFAKIFSFLGKIQRYLYIGKNRIYLKTDIAICETQFLYIKSFFKIHTDSFKIHLIYILSFEKKNIGLTCKKEIYMSVILSFQFTYKKRSEKVTLLLKQDLKRHKNVQEQKNGNFQIGRKGNFLS